MVAKKVRTARMVKITKERLGLLGRWNEVSIPRKDRISRETKSELD